MISTTRGKMSEKRLDKVVGFENRGTEFVIWTEWRVKGEAPMPLFAAIADEDMAKIGRIDRREVVKRDCHVILKAPSVISDALAASLS